MLTTVAVVAPHKNATASSLAGSGSARSIHRNAARTTGTGTIARPSDSANPGAPADIPISSIPTIQIRELTLRVIHVVSRNARPVRAVGFGAAERGIGCTACAVGT